MNKRNLLFAMTMMVGTLAATAQDVINIHLKDGTTHSFLNNVKAVNTNMYFWSHQPDTTTYKVPSTHDNGYTSSWNVNAVFHQNKEYLAAIFWMDDLPLAMNAKHGVCFGTKPGLTIENSDTTAIYNKQNNTLIAYNDESRYLDASHEHYMLIGPRLFDRLSSVLRYIYYQHPLNTSGGPLFMRFGQNTDNFIKCPMEYGKTYFYRTFAIGEVNGKEVVFYGQERSFRVPQVMADADYYDRVYPTAEAQQTFKDKFFGTAQKLDWTTLEPLWDEWRATSEGASIDLKADITTQQFDDGLGYRLNRIPDEFYTWLANRTITIDAFDDLQEISMSINAQGDSIPTAHCVAVIVTDPSWGVESGKYIRFMPVQNSMNYYAMYNGQEIIPGVNYQLQLFMAPETEYPQTEENASMFLPTKVRVTAQSQYSVQEVSGTQATTITIDNVSTNAWKQNIKVETRVSNREMNARTYNRIMRIAGMRLTPVKN